MHINSRRPARLACLSVGLATVGILLAGCAPAAPTSNAHVALFASTDRQVNVRVEANLQYGTADNAPLLLDICLPSAPGGTAPANTALTLRPVIVSIHGGSWEHGDKAVPAWRDVCMWLASAGYVTASVDYRLAPAHPFPAAIDDIRTAVRWLRAPAQVKHFQIDPTLIGAFGGSAGGNLAALLGTTGTGPRGTGDRVAAVVDISGPTNLTSSGPEHAPLAGYQLQYLGCATLVACQKGGPASPLFQVGAGDPPFFVAHSLRERVPLTQATRFVARLRSAGIATTFVPVDGTLHSLAMMTPGLEKRIIAFYQATLVHAASGAN